MNLLTCQAGYENLLGEEIRSAGGLVESTGPGWLLGEDSGQELTFAHARFDSPVSVEGTSVNSLAQGILGAFCESIKADRIESPWPCIFSGPMEAVGLGRRIASVRSAFHEALKKRFGRVAKLASDDWPRIPGPQKGLFVWFTDFGSARVSRVASTNGQRRMADDDAAPSRSYLKVEEAYGIIGQEPCPGETVCDLGAAPGGWSYSAAKRGAKVLAIDNGPLKGGALGHPLITHLPEDAFRYRPPAPVDWLFCDLVEEPHHVLGSLIAPWIEGKLCRRFILNFKFGRVDPILLLRQIHAFGSPLASLPIKVRHLYHDRDEFTVMGNLP